MTPDQTKCEIGELSKEQLAEHVRTVQALRKYGAPDTPLQLSAEALLSHIANLTARLEQAERDARRYRFWRQRQYNGMLDVDEYCDENSPQAVHFDRLTDAAMESSKEGV